MSCVPLMRASPSLASSTTGARPAAARASAPESDAALGRADAFADEGQREVGQGREVAARAHAALGGHDRMHAAR